MANKLNKVNIFDPNDLDHNGSTFNVEDLTIFVELTAKRKGRSIINITDKGNIVSSDNDTFIVNMMGFDQVNKYNTTNWTENNPEFPLTQYEGFGIIKINVKINSSFLPIVNIEFIDIHGLSFFNNDKSSPYKVLFDFPPPIFTLTIKGYYGKALKYDLHLVKTNIKYNTDTGNYHINSEFIARTFAPLTDVLFKYVEYFPLMKEGYKPSTDGIPKNTHELILRLRNLYDDIGKVTKNSKYNVAMDESRENIRDINELFGMIKYYKNNLTIDSNGDNVVMMAYDVITNDNTADSDYTLKPIDYDSYLRYINRLGNTSVDPNITKKLYIGVINTTQDVDNILIAYRAQLLSKAYAINLITKQHGEITQELKEDVKGIYEFKISENKTYKFIDISNLIQLMLIKLNNNIEIFNKNSTEYKDEINTLPIDNLGFEPTIHNIFKILCDDIDTFFETMQKCYDDSYKHHKKYYNNISTSGVNGVLSKNSIILPFPEAWKLDSSVVEGRQTKTIPISISDSLPEKFPEIELVDRFLDTYIEVLKEELVTNLKSKIGENGTNIWVPFSPIDSELYPDAKNGDSPYYNFIKGKNLDLSPIDNILNILLSRYYIISNYVFSDIFNSTELKLNKYGSLISYLAEAEAANIINSVVNKDILNILMQISDGGIDSLYQRFATYNNDLYNNVDTDKIINNEIEIYCSKSNENFIGTSFINIENVKTIEIDGDDSEPVNKFISTYNKQKNFFKRLIGTDKARDIEKYSEENLIYLSDDPNNFVYTKKYRDTSSRYLIPLTNSGTIYTQMQSNFLDNSSSYLFIYNFISNYPIYKNYMLDILSNTQLEKKYKALLLISNFGRIATPFDRTNSTTTEISDPNGIRANLLIPSISEMPYGSILYIGGIVNLFDDKNFITFLNDLAVYTTNTYKTDVEPLFGKPNISKIIQNIEDINKYLSPNDRTLYEKYFTDFVVNETGNEFMTSTYTTFEKSYLSMLNDSTTNENYEQRLERIHKSEAFEVVNKRIGILVHSSKAYSIEPDSGSQYTPLSDRTLPSLSTIDDEFFKNFLIKLKSYASDRLKYLSNLETKYLGKLDNDDIRTRVYYSFKNISDKWLSLDSNTKFPTIDDNLIDNFRFVDRAMNDIGGNNRNGSILDVKNLVELSTDFDMNMLTLFSTILSHNNFEFFPLQNFMTYSNNEWNTESFRPTSNNNLDISNTPAFLCVYVGGLSKVINDDTGVLPNDGIFDLENMGGDFIGDIEGDTSRYVNAFIVSVAGQNQSIFIGVDIDTEEYPETNESLKILSDIAKDESNSSPEPVASNLFNMYQQRAYSSTITMLGNVMIQPTQYYEIRNLPMFNGAYEILEVEHDISPNHMITKFTGVKVPQTPQPIVSNFSTSIGVSNNTPSLDVSNVNSIITNSQINNRITSYNIPDAINYNSMFTFKS